jgi:hypothetical protein
VAVRRIERYRRFLLRGSGGARPCTAAVDVFASLAHDRMTEWRLRAPLLSFESGAAPARVCTVPLRAEGLAPRWSVPT